MLFVNSNNDYSMMVKIIISKCNYNKIRHECYNDNNKN